MNMSKVGKFETLKIVNAFDKALIELYGVNMTDARISRYEVLESYGETGDAARSAELFAERRGMRRLAEAG
ncbi:MAG: hypothetical protein AB1642_12880 [Pseudomonadota bacterium]